MSEQTSDTAPNPPIPPEDLYGVYVNLDGGEEDSTVRPSQVLREQRGLAASQDTGESTSPPQPEP